MTESATDKKILIVEDNELNMNLFNLLLTTAGYKTIQCVDGNDVWDTVKRTAPDLIIMDIQLPGRSGVELTRELKTEKTTQSIPIIAVTAFSMVGDERKIRDAGCDDYLSKPVEIEGFLDTVARNLP